MIHFGFVESIYFIIFVTYFNLCVRVISVADATVGISVSPSRPGIERQNYTMSFHKVKSVVILVHSNSTYISFLSK